MANDMKAVKYIPRHLEPMKPNAIGVSQPIVWSVLHPNTNKEASFTIAMKGDDIIVIGTPWLWQYVKDLLKDIGVNKLLWTLDIQEYVDTKWIAANG